MAGSTQIYFPDDMIGDPNDLDDLIEATGRDLSDVSGDERRQSEAEEDGQRSDIERQGSNDERGGSDNDGENKNKDANSDDPPKKRRKLAPRLNLNPQRLKGPRGLTALLKEFETFKFKGKGKEKEDIERVLAKMEHWAHRLHPKLHFEDFIAKAEKLCTKKKEMQVYMNRMRMGLETGEDDGIIRDEDDDEDAPRTVQNEALNEFDKLLDQQISYYDENPREPARTPKTPSTLPPSPAFVPIMASTLTTEQKELIARKKKEAVERRLARLKELEEQHLREATEASLVTAVGETSDGTSGLVTEIAAEPEVQVPSKTVDSLADQRERAARNKQLALERLRARRLAAQGITQPTPDLNVSSSSDLAVPLSPRSSQASPTRGSPVKSPKASSPSVQVVEDSIDMCHETSPDERHLKDGEVSSERGNRRHSVSEKTGKVASSDSSRSERELPSTVETLAESPPKSLPDVDMNSQETSLLVSQRMDEVIDVISSEIPAGSTSPEKMVVDSENKASPQSAPSLQDKNFSLLEKMDESDE